MPNIPMFQAPTAPGQALQPQSAGSVGYAPVTGSAAPSSFDPKQLAAALGQNTPGSGQPDLQMQTSPMALGNGQDTSQMTSQGYPVGGSGQMANQQNFMGGSGTPSYTWMPSWFQGGI